MDLIVLNEFLTVAETAKNGSGSFAQAAKMLNTYPSTLSKHIKLLEDELGASLFDRTTRRVSLSDFGRYFLPYAQEMYSSYEKCQTAIEQYIFSESPALRYGTVFPVTADKDNQYMRAMRTCMKRFPNCSFQLVELHNWILKAMLRSGKLEFIIAYQEESDNSEFTSYPICRDNLVALVSEEHPLCSEPYISLDMLQNEQIITNPLNSYMGNLVYSSCQAAGFIPYVWYSDNSNSNLANMADRGGGVGLMMESSAHVLVGPHTKVIPLKPSITLQLCLFSLRERKLSPVSTTFIEELLQTSNTPPESEEGAAL